MVKDFVDFTAKEAREMELHKNDIMFGVRERCYAEIRAAALAGQVGIVFKYPMNYIGFAEFDIFAQELIDNGFIVFEQNAVYGGQGCMGIYWGPCEIHEATNRA